MCVEVFFVLKKTFFLFIAVWARFSPIWMQMYCYENQYVKYMRVNCIGNENCVKISFFHAKKSWFCLIWDFFPRYSISFQWYCCILFYLNSIISWLMNHEYHFTNRLWIAIILAMYEMNMNEAIDDSSVFGFSVLTKIQNNLWIFFNMTKGECPLFDPIHESEQLGVFSR